MSNVIELPQRRAPGPLGHDDSISSRLFTAISIVETVRDTMEQGENCYETLGVALLELWNLSEEIEQLEARTEPEEPPAA